MPRVSISRKFEFSASHRYWRDEWSAEKNQRVFGKCTSPHGHGHNYELHVTLTGPIDPKTGMIVNLTEVKRRVGHILDGFDHKYLNVDTPYFKDRLPTTENLALVLFDLIRDELEKDGFTVPRIRLYERHDLYVEVCL
ncbi:MAG: 6-carboxytetrahydropterin synthase [Calditrichaeota bacterium]|nr:MAG: 6-carboxytetrahydropterin synthase [Calditrichota bacterium]